MAGYAVAHLDEIDEFVDGRCHYRPIRHHLGVTAFGVTAWTAQGAGDLVIDEHDPGDPTADEELFLVLRGRRHRMGHGARHLRELWWRVLRGDQQTSVERLSRAAPR